MKRSLYLLALVALSFSACTKELSYEHEMPGSNGGNGNGNGNGNTNRQLEGTYDFVGLSAQMNATMDYKDEYFEYTLESITEYASTKTAGTMEFRNGVAYCRNFSYSIAGTLIAKDGGIVVSRQPIAADIPTASSQANYQKIGNDSIYMPQGSTIDLSTGAGNVPMQSEPQGQKYAWSGDTLILTGYVNMRKTEVDDGATMQTHTTGKIITKLKKRP